MKKHTVRYNTSLSDEPANDQMNGRWGGTGYCTRCAYTTQYFADSVKNGCHCVYAHCWRLQHVHMLRHIHSHEVTFCTSCTLWSMQKQQLNSWILKPTRKIMNNLERTKQNKTEKLKRCALFFSDWNSSPSQGNKSSRLFDGKANFPFELCSWNILFCCTFLPRKWNFSQTEKTFEKPYAGATFSVRQPQQRHHQQIKQTACTKLQNARKINRSR